MREELPADCDGYFRLMSIEMEGRPLPQSPGSDSLSTVHDHDFIERSIYSLIEESRQQSGVLMEINALQSV